MVTTVDKDYLRRLIGEYRAEKRKAARYSLPSDCEVAIWQDAIRLAERLLDA
jgi:hypothetical protein